MCREEGKNMIKTYLNLKIDLSNKKKYSTLFMKKEIHIVKMPILSKQNVHWENFSHGLGDLCVDEHTCTMTCKHIGFCLFCFLLFCSLVLAVSVV